MAAQWDQTIEHVFNSSSITSTMRKEYPAVYKLMLDELESASTYMGWTAKMKSIPFQWTSALSGKHDESHLIQSVSKCLEADLPPAAREKIGRVIADKCFNCLPSLSAIPPGKPCMIANRVDSLDDWNSNSLFWSCGVDLNLFEGESTSARSPSKGFRLGGNFNLSILACHRGILDKTETHAHKDYNEVKNTIMNACPRLPLFSPVQHSIQSNHRSLSTENDSALRSSSTARHNEPNDERLMLRSTMDSDPDSMISLLEIRKHKDVQFSPDAVLELLYHMQDYINYQLPGSKAFIVQDYLIIVYPQNMTAVVTEKLRDFDSNGRYFTSKFVIQKNWNRLAINHQKLSSGVKYNDIIKNIS